MLHTAHSRKSGEEMLEAGVVQYDYSWCPLREIEYAAVKSGVVSKVVDVCVSAVHFAPWRISRVEAADRGDSLNASVPISLVAPERNIGPIGQFGRDMKRVIADIGR